MQYLTVGTDEIYQSKFRPVGNRTDSIKPTGGLWLTKYYNRCNNDWVNYLLENPDTLYSKTDGEDIYVQPCSLVTLKDNSFIYMLRDDISYRFLMNCYSDVHEKLSFERLSLDFDGMFIDLSSLKDNMNGLIPFQMLDEYSVDTLILFNLDCIDYYQSGKVIIDYDPSSIYDIDVSDYEIKVDNVRKRVK